MITAKLNFNEFIRLAFRWILGISLAILSCVNGYGQTASSSDNLTAQPIADRDVPFDITASGVSKTVIFGADLAWANEQNFRRAIRFMGKDQTDVARVSFQATQRLIDGDLQQDQIDALNYRLGLVETYGSSDIEVVMNSDSPTVDTYYYGNAENWKNLLKVTAQRIEDRGFPVISIGPMNEPDYSTNQGTRQHFYDIVVEMNNDSYFDDIRISGGNTLNTDVALEWYNYLDPAGLTEGNTHQLAGSFDNYANFFQTVRSNGDWASNDELHNVMEALVGYEYGMQMGIWWGHADYARGEMVKAFDGERIGYAEHRPNWTAAAVYRTPEGKVQAFGGTSERQARPTSYNYISTDRVVYYDGHGPQRSFVLEMPGDPEGQYWDEQTNAERVINITWGEDIQPAINGQYKLVNRESGEVMMVTGNANENGANVEAGTYSGLDTQQWNVVPVEARIGGDFSYYRIYPVSSNNKYLDLYNFSLENGANFNLWDKGNGGNQQYYLDYNEDGWFYIRNRESSYGVVVDDSGNVVQHEVTGDENQQWRFIPVDAEIEFNAPGAPANLTVIANEVTIDLEWTANSEADLAGYTILRADSAGGEYNTIARDVTSNAFVDNSVLTGKTYYYKVRAQDKSLNRSGYSNEVSASASGDDILVAHYKFEGNTQDATNNFNNSASFGEATFAQANDGSKALSLDGSEDYLQLPETIANHDEITVATWVYWDGGGQWKRIFDFGNGQEEYMFLTPSNGSSQLYFGIKNDGTEQGLSASALPSGEWVHVAVTLGADKAAMYVDGSLVDESTSISISPIDFKPVMNYIGRSQFPDHLFNGRIDDFRIYNYSLAPEQIAELAKEDLNVLVKGKGETCPDSNNGEISVEVNLASGYTATIDGSTYDFTDQKLVVSDLAPGTYDVCVASNNDDYEQCFSVEIPGSDDISASMATTNGKMHVQVNSGTAPYKVKVNGWIQFETNEKSFEVDIRSGDLLEVSSAKDCEGVLSKEITILGRVTASPNPSTGRFEIFIPTEAQSVKMEIYNVNSRMISTANYQIIDGKVIVNIEDEPAGVYFIRVNSNPVETIRIIKK